MGLILTDSYDEVMAERDKGKPRPYSKGHRNHLLPNAPPACAPVSLLSARIQAFMVVAGALIIIYGIHGLLTDDLFIPGRGTAGRHYQGTDAQLMFAVLVSFTTLFMVIGCNV